ncbi:hypothetical protein [Aliiroseovarius subalbicans]|uniref:hypothetical protein n=1 Tax=Aliiroseovarius subalbicans TaxID=2925840 RepID=UPI001F55CD99|nr:hypothetical protein [Aliiroseovarius subalbicans]MCI2398326.1 hypothetical protein [Aliiroseovarius subalbicans]
MIRSFEKTAPVLGLIAAMGAGPALAETSCTFTQECFQTLECEESAYEVTVDLEAGTFSDLTGTRDIIAVNDGAMAKTAVIEGYAGYQLLTMGAHSWILTIHNSAGPAQLTYYGDCEGEK